jgi:hypothetical protein
MAFNKAVRPVFKSGGFYADSTPANNLAQSFTALRLDDGAQKNGDEMPSHVSTTKHDYVDPFLNTATNRA